MNPDAITQANAQQALASDPSVSAFVSASAGSGKTKLLIDRLLRLMLPRLPPGNGPDAGPHASPDAGTDAELAPGSDPARIQCLTFTKAAAAEMSIRLQDQLGRWVTLADAALDAELRGLQVAPSAATRQAARALFARVLDLPGGMRISTIHAFCQSLLRRFPLEAAISPHFALAEETDSRLGLAAAADAELCQRVAGDPAVALLAGQVSVADFTSLIAGLRSRLRDPSEAAALLHASRQGLEPALRRAAGITHAEDEQACLAGGVSGPDEAHLRAMLELARQRGTKAAIALADKRLDWLALGHEARAREWDVWCRSFLTEAGEPRANGGFSKAAWLNTSPEIPAAMRAEAMRIIDLEDARRSIRMAALTAALLGLALPILQRHDGDKRRGSLLDYDDLIARTLALLDDPGVAWVLFKLDGGIDHLLLDEVQDTSPLQWQIAWALTGEFFAGRGAREERRLPRTIFAVGDYKQSIYAFQGADPAQFHFWRQRFRARVEDGGGIWREPSLTVSFRSVEPVLRLVDCVFASPEAARGLIERGQPSLPPHRASRVGEPGFVELWPLIPIEEKLADSSPWQAPVRNLGQDTAPQRLAEALARWIAREIGAAREDGTGAGREDTIGAARGDTIGAARDDGAAPLRAGDVLILVPRRSAFVRALIRALKSEDVPVATLVRTGLVDQVAVMDLLALCDALLLPQDDLTVSCVLTSPLGGLSDDSLMQLATTRGSLTMWDSLRLRHQSRPDWTAAWGFLAALFARVDYATPYALLGEALGRLGGRARLLARLGPEASEPVDELLSAALRYEDSHPPSLQGFVHWLRHSEATIRREPDSAGDAVRVMTVHGAKGLQARLVVLPDTNSAPQSDDKLLWTRDPQTGAALPFWVPRGEFACKPTHALSTAIRDAMLEERNRLLYVALTRARDRLVICGWQVKRPPEGAWYGLCQQGFVEAGAVPSPFALGWPGERLVIETAGGGAAMAHAAPTVPMRATLPDWLGRAPDWRATTPPSEPRLPDPLAPSRPEGVAFGVQPAALSPLRSSPGGRQAGIARGRLLHALLQHLPAVPPAARRQAARSYLSRPAHRLGDDDVEALIQQLLAVLEDPAIAPLFGPQGRAEQPLAGVAEGMVVNAQVDRLFVSPHLVLVADFKTGRAAPASVMQTPVLYLRQMAAYRALLRDLYPERTITCLLVWTEEASVMALPDALLDMHRPGVGPVSSDAVPA